MIFFLMGFPPNITVWFIFSLSAVHLQCKVVLLSVNQAKVVVVEKALMPLSTINQLCA